MPCPADTSTKGEGATLKEDCTNKWKVINRYKLYIFCWKLQDFKEFVRFNVTLFKWKIINNVLL